MKKLLLIGALLLSSLMFSQETFVKKYYTSIAFKAGVKQQWESVDLTVVFNAEGKRKIVLYYSDGKVKVLHQVSGAVEEKTVDGDGYQFISCIDEKGNQVGLQLFDDDTCLRIIVDKGWYVEFHND